MSDRGTGAAGTSAPYEIEPKNKYFEATRAIVEHEIRPGNTVTFLAEVDLTEVERLRAPSVPGKETVVHGDSSSRRSPWPCCDFPYANRRVCRRAWLPFCTPRLQRFLRRDVAVACERDIPGAESTAFIDIVRDADRLSLAEITEALRDLSVCDVNTNQQWREFSTLITRLPTWLSAWLIRFPAFVPGLWVKYRGGAVLVSSPAKYGRRRRWPGHGRTRSASPSAW